MKNKTGKILNVLFLGCISALLVTQCGCKTTAEGKTVPDTERIALVSREAAAIGTADVAHAVSTGDTKFLVQPPKPETAKD